MIECSPWWQWSSGLNDRPQQGKHHMAQTGSLLKMENKCDTLFSLLMFYVVKRSNISALDALISVESRAAWETETERKVGGWRVFLLFWHPPLCHQRSDTLLLLFKKKKKKQGLERCIMGTEEFDDRKHFERWPELTLHILLCNVANSCQCGTKHSSLKGFLTRSKTSHRHSCVESVSWVMKLDVF